MRRGQHEQCVGFSKHTCLIKTKKNKWASGDGRIELHSAFTENKNKQKKRKKCDAQENARTASIN